MKKEKQKLTGFTLIEIMVAIIIFVVIIASPTGFLVGSLRAQQKALAAREMADSISYALEYMSRAVRMAKKDDIGGAINCLSGVKVNYEATASGQGGLKFRNYQDLCQEFYLQDGQIFEVKDGGNSLPITSNDLEITEFNVFLSGEGQGDNLQPKVTISFEANGSFLQTTISQRNLDVLY